MSETHKNILGICGFKKSGKTTLIEALLVELNRKGLRLGVIKRQNEPVQTDLPGSDTYRFFQAGASVLGWDGIACLVKQHQPPPFSLDQALERLGGPFDLVLVEGFKESPVDKIWLLRDGETDPPEELTHIRAALSFSDDRLQRTLDVIRARFNINI